MSFKKWGYVILGLVLVSVPLFSVQTGLAQEQASPTSGGPGNSLLAQAAPGWEVAFVSGRDGNPEIYAAAADGSNSRRLTSDPAMDGAPAWSPDGSQIAFHSDRGGNLDIYTMNADGSAVRRLTDSPAPDSDPAWSPGGCQIAFVSERDGNPEIYVMNADGSNLLRLTNDPGRDAFPAWSPDGTQIAFSSDRSGSIQLYLMDPTGANVQPVTNLSGANAWLPAWSPDSSLLSYTVESSSVGIYTMTRQGQNQTALGPQPGVLTLTDWSPDGQWLLFTSASDGNQNVMVMDRQGQNLSRVTDNPADDFDPDWRPLPVAQCTVRTDQPQVRLFVGPGFNRSVFSWMPSGQDIKVVGRAADGEGNQWWEIDKTQIDGTNEVNSLWVLQSDVQAGEGCAQVCAVPASPLVIAEPPTSTGTWGTCGSCQTCGHPANECETSPTGECVWDPANCVYTPPSQGPGCLTLSASVNPPGYGSIIFRYPENCKGGGWNPGSHVVMVAVPGPRRTFVNWTGDCPGLGANTLVDFTISSSCSATANFQ